MCSDCGDSLLTGPEAPALQPLRSKYPHLQARAGNAGKTGPEETGAVTEALTTGFTLKLDIH